MSAYVQKGGISERVNFVPPIFDKEKLTEQIREADVICVPSLSGETFSMAVLEGMAQAKPILVSDFGPMPEAIDHLVNGYVSPAGDVTGISEAISYFSTHRDEMERLGTAAYNKACDHFSSSVIAQEYLSDFRHLLSRPLRNK